MDPDFWISRWQSGQIGFHQGSVHEDLLVEGDRWLGPEPSRVLVPLCGKSLDLVWLAERAAARGQARSGTEVLGVELVEEAVAAFFADRGLAPTRRPAGPFEAWSAPELPALTILRGDIFDLGAAPAELGLGAVGRVWDRAALVALPPPLRARYAALLRTVLPPGARMMLNTFELGPEDQAGPPFSVRREEVEALYAGCPLRLVRSVRSAASPGVKARGHDSLLTLTYEVTLQP